MAPRSETAPSSRSVDPERVLDAAAAIVAEVGLRGLTLRDLAQALGKSTTVIVNLFGSRAGLTAALAAAALEQDRDFHHRFFADLGELEPSRDALLAVLGRYLRRRALPCATFVRIWEELVVGGEPETAPTLRAWEAMRLDAWKSFLSRDPKLAPMAEVVTTYLVIEQFYAGALADRADYEAIAAEGLGGLVDRAFGLEDAPATTTEAYVARMTIPEAPAGDGPNGAIRLKLLDVAADQILAGGLPAMTNRSVCQAAGVSTSTIAYHWNDMRRFQVDAIWRCVFRDMPQQLDYRRPAPSASPTLESWSALMATTARSGDSPGEGFYVRYARLIAHICLEARRDPQLQALAMILRGPEGGGTYTGRAEVWPPRFDLSRRAATRFALWIKGRALIGAALGEAPTPVQMIESAEQLVQRRLP
ncbi:TetR family transcriptional regulator [Caulobacter endophyticus]|uniref:TetR family transcriptional regulator n=1 Tax=Caulobacter endophyticus TaxID=2172652 RepID=UPI0024101E6A|nr:TetR family transcriptional regulator [Caulobacter endophyticus]MDG2531746.1 TetR family transcriptional regulator [Caulobacter endophyticus]